MKSLILGFVLFFCILSVNAQKKFERCYNDCDSLKKVTMYNAITCQMPIKFVRETRQFNQQPNNLDSVRVLMMHPIEWSEFRMSFIDTIHLETDSILLIIYFDTFQNIVRKDKIGFKKNREFRLIEVNDEENRVVFSEIMNCKTSVYRDRFVYDINGVPILKCHFASPSGLQRIDGLYRTSVDNRDAYFEKEIDVPACQCDW